MTFTSPEFVIFFSVFVPLYFVFPFRFRWLLLLVASYFFYAYGSGIYVLLIVFTTFVDYAAARAMGAAASQRRRRLYLAASLAANLGTLFLFKYFNFFNQSFATLTGASASPLNLLLPVGISFYTFQSMAYTIDVYRGKIAPEKHFGIMAAFVAFFPQLVAGPIERAPHFLPQFRANHGSLRVNFDAQRTVAGLRLILWGAFKKIVIADRLAIYVNTVYSTPESYSGLPLVLATVFFAFQVYGDFSAYSDIAIGAAKILGFDLMLNFRQPFFAKSVREFWARWHISLSTWFRDYLYIPLGGSRVTFPRHLFNLFVVFLVSGLWHGASWTFVLWGGLHGLYVVAEIFLSHLKLRFKPPAALRVAITFALVVFAFIFFRASSFTDAQYIVAHLFAFSGQSLSEPFAAGLLGAQTEFVLAFALIALLLLVDGLIERFGFERLWSASPDVLRWATYYAAGAAVIFSGLYGVGAQQFIYFQF